VKFRQRTCMREAMREAIGDDLSLYLDEQASTGGSWDDVEEIGAACRRPGQTAEYLRLKPAVASARGLVRYETDPLTYREGWDTASAGPVEVIGHCGEHRGLRDSSVITTGYWHEDDGEGEDEDEVGGRRSRRRKRRRARAQRRRARRAARKAARARRRKKRRKAVRKVRKALKAKLHKVAKRLSKSKVLKGLRKGWSALLKSPIAQKVIGAGAKALQAFGVPASATRAVLTQMKNNAIARMDAGGLPAMLARASHKDAKRGAFFRELGKRQLAILPQSLIAAIPGGLGGNIAGKLKGLGPKKLVGLAKQLGGGKLSTKQIGTLAKKMGAGKIGLKQLKLLRKVRAKAMAHLGPKGGNLPAAFKKMGTKQLLGLAKNLGGGKLSKRQIIKLAKSMRSGKVGLKELRALKKLRKVRHSKAVVSLAMKKRMERRGRSRISNVRRDELRRMLKSKRGRRKLQTALIPRGSRRKLLSHANPRVKVSGEFLGQPGYENSYRF